MDYFTFKLTDAFAFDRRPRRFAVVFAEDWESAQELLSRFGYAERMLADPEALKHGYRDEWQKAVAEAQPWLGSVRIDGLIVTGNTFALRPRDAVHLEEDAKVTMIVVASDGPRQRVLSWDLTGGRTVHVQRGQELVDEPDRNLFLGDGESQASGRDLANAILKAFP